MPPTARTPRPLRDQENQYQHTQSGEPSGTPTHPENRPKCQIDTNRQIPRRTVPHENPPDPDQTPSCIPGGRARSRSPRRQPGMPAPPSTRSTAYYAPARILARKSPGSQTLRKNPDARYQKLPNITYITDLWRIIL